MRYVKAGMILPDSLVREIQKYSQGEYLYPISTGKQKKMRRKLREKRTDTK